MERVEWYEESRLVSDKALLSRSSTIRGKAQRAFFREGWVQSEECTQVA